MRVETITIRAYPNDRAMSTWCYKQENPVKGPTPVGYVDSLEIFESNTERNSARCWPPLAVVRVDQSRLVPNNGMGHYLKPK
jgi:hypothetical protein